jgi:drug/metabolite transporter (DMT)-like permease
VAFLGLKVACSVALALILKHVDQKGISRLGLIRVNYAAAAVIAFLLLVVGPPLSVSRNTLWVAALAGVSYVAALVIWSKAIQQNGIALTVGFTRISVIVPVLVSMLVWKEIPRWHQGLGIVLGIVAMLITGRQAATSSRPQAPQGKRFGGQLLLFVLFAVSGVAALSSKLFQELCPMQENLHFQALLFVVAFMVTTILCYIEKQKIEKVSLEWGAILGGVNLGSSVFMILALGLVSGTLAFPTSAAAEVAVIAVLGRVVWKERLDRLSVVGLVLTVVALLLVQIT